jgi:hypothetical protein
MTTLCGRVRQHFGAFVDGELPGRDRLLVSEHIAACEVCAAEVQGVRETGELLREAALATPWRSADLAGLASGAISRVRAEQAQSWRAVFERAIEDWHWAIVGVGSVSAAFVSVMAVSALFWFGPAPAREDSLAALINNLDTSAGTLLVVATPVGRDQNPMLMQFDNGDSAAATSGPTAVPVGFMDFSGPVSEHDLVLALSEAVMRPDGRMSDLGSMSQIERKHTVDLLNKIESLRDVRLTAWSGTRVTVQKVGLVTSTGVSAKAL